MRLPFSAATLEIGESFGTTIASPAGADFVYIGYDPASPLAEAIVVPKDSPIKSVAELKGKKVALNKGSNVHYLLVKALEKAGLAYSDVQTVFLPPADARAAFERGAVDAWVIWDPFLAAAEKQLGARVLADGRGLVSNHQFYLASRAPSCFSAEARNGSQITQASTAPRSKAARASAGGRYTACTSV